MQVKSERRLLTTREAAAYIGMSQAYLRLARTEGATGNRTPGPKFYRIGARCVRYSTTDLDAWLRQFREGGSDND